MLFIQEKYVICKGPFKCYVTQMGWGVSDFFWKKRYEGVMFNVNEAVGGGPIYRKIALRNTWMAPNRKRLTFFGNDVAITL